MANGYVTAAGFLKFAKHCTSLKYLKTIDAHMHQLREPTLQILYVMVQRAINTGDDGVTALQRCTNLHRFKIETAARVENIKDL